jgi:hypothetical protein
MAATSSERIDGWRPGCWCAAMLKLCDEHIVEGEHEDTRYPEQWMAMLWRPMAQALPWWRPDGWAFTVGLPLPWIAQSVDGAAVYFLAEHECLWSAWLDMALACERTDGLRGSRRRQQVHGPGHQGMAAAWKPGSRARRSAVLGKLYRRFLRRGFDAANGASQPSIMAWDI